ncbi:MAG: DUF1232 domain-containing protein [Fibrobacterota bacterium]
MFERLKSAGRALREEIAVYRRVLTDPRTPRLAKILLGLGVAYLLSPIDLIPDTVPGLGMLDDVVIAGLVLFIVRRLIPPAIIEEHRTAVKQEKENRHKA